ncbi:ArnT family glycosyltransferase [Chloroflexota bacterium]
MSTFGIYSLSLLGLLGLTAALYFAWYRWSSREAEPDEPPPPEFSPQAYHLELPDGGRVEIQVKAGSKKKTPTHQLTETDHQLRIEIDHSGQAEVKIEKQPAWYTPNGAAAAIKPLLRAWPYSLAQTLFTAALVLYALTHLIGLSEYPIFFFTDEAIQTNQAANFIRDDFRNAEGEFFPTYFENVDKYSLSLTVYMQVLPYLLFGKSVFVTRATAVLVTILGAYWLGMILREIYETKYWWAVTILLSITPAWFLHSRTAFEAATFASLYTGFMYYYLLYRRDQPRKLYLALILGALAFYSYNPGRVVVTLTGIGLLLSDLGYHWQQRKFGFKALGLLALLALPFVRFYLAHPTAQLDQLRLLASYWVQPIPLSEKLTTYFENYGRGLNIGYWFLPNDHDLARHRMNGYPHILSQLLPFAVVGFGLSAWRVKKSRNRALLISLLVAPSGSALVGIGITRALVYVIPALLLATIGLSAALEWVEKRGAAHSTIALALFLLLGGANIGLTADALVNGPIWETEYGLTGMQYGGRQLFTSVEDYLIDNPRAEIYLSPTWTNGADVVAHFFMPDPLPFTFGSVDRYMHNLMNDTEEKTFVVTPEEYQEIIESGKFTNIDIKHIIPYPNSEPGFYFLEMEYVSDIAEILVEEMQERLKPVHTSIEINGQVVEIEHSKLDMGAINLVFDGDPFTVARTEAANPFALDIKFPEARTLSYVSAVIGSAQVELRVTIYVEGESTPVVMAGKYQGSVDEPQVVMQFEPPLTTQRLRVTILDIDQQEPANVHLWELTFGEDQ